MGDKEFQSLSTLSPSHISHTWLATCLLWCLCSAASWTRTPSLQKFYSSLKIHFWCHFPYDAFLPSARQNHWVSSVVTDVYYNIYEIHINVKIYNIEIHILQYVLLYNIFIILNIHVIIYNIKKSETYVILKCRHIAQRYFRFSSRSSNIAIKQVTWSFLFLRANKSCVYTRVY